METLTEMKSALGDIVKTGKYPTPEFDTKYSKDLANRFLSAGLITVRYSLGQNGGTTPYYSVCDLGNQYYKDMFGHVEYYRLKIQGLFQRQK